jgi:hypothetical protein
MNKYRILIGCLLVLAGLIVVLTFLPAKKTVSVSEETETVGGVRSERVSPVRITPESAAEKKASVLKQRLSAELVGPAEEREKSGAKVSAGGSPEKKDAVAREKAVAAWEALVDQVIGQKEAPTVEQAKHVKEVFDKLDKDDQMDGVHRALNLFPDEQFPALYDILYDKKEDPEVLDAIFSDALNRPDELKNPLMKELRKDREHPMFFESARILDVVVPGT